MTSEAEKQLDATITRMNKKFGDKVVGRLGDRPIECEVIPTGSLALDLALGVGGIPRKRITEIFGLPGSGKTTLCQHISAECQAMGGTAAYIDMEYKLSTKYAAACGVDIESLVFSQPPSGQAALEIARALIPSVDLIVVDSVYDLVTTAELESDVGDQHFALLARFMSQEIKKLKPLLGLSNCAMVFVNQVRTGIGQGGYTYHTEPGGFSLQFAASIKVKMRRTGELPHGSGIASKAKVAKNNVACPFKECEISILHGEGIDKAADIVEAGIDSGAIERAGAWYKLDGENIADTSGKQPVIAAVRADPKLAQDIRTRALEAIK